MPSTFACKVPGSGQPQNQARFRIPPAPDNFAAAIPDFHKMQEGDEGYPTAPAIEFTLGYGGQQGSSDWHQMATAVSWGSPPHFMKRERAKSSKGSKTAASRVMSK